ncbi:MAG: Fic/DOC family [Microbacteriaceae bacterium]|nr:Fic/DOC family [Microbacteriaceae bacterium]
MSENAEGGWPAVDYEQRHWEPAIEVRDSFGPHRASSGPYRAVVPPRIAALEIRLSPETMASSADATAELIRFDTEFGAQDSPVGALLLRAEGTASAAIEGVTSNAQAIALAELEESHEPIANEIAGNARAIELALFLCGSLSEAGQASEDAVVQVQRALMASTRPERRGRWRDQQVWIGGGSLGPHRASFVPPHQSRLPELMNDLMQFVRRRDLPALAQIAIAHAQYETVHPFLEVNGRTGRALMQAMLRRGDVTRSIAVPVSAGLLQDTAAYFDALTKYRAGKIDPIVEVFSRASFTAVANSRELIDDLAAVRQSWAARSTSRQGSGARRLIELLERQPVINSRSAIEYLGVTAPNAQLAIDRLVADDILTQVGSTRRNRVWAAREIIDVLDAFAERARRRR